MKMTLFALVFTTLLALVAGQCSYHDRILGGSSDSIGGSMGGDSIGGHHMGTGGPIVTTTTVTTVTDLSTGMTKAFRSMTNPMGSEKRVFEGVGLSNIFSENDLNVIKTSWNTLKRRGDFAPKVFVRYFKAKPEAQKLFPNFANVPINELPTNHEFLNIAYTCVNSLSYIIPHLKYPHPENCPVLADLKNKYNEVDLKKFGSIWMTAMQEELGEEYTPEVRDVWKKAIMALSNYASQ